MSNGTMFGDLDWPVSASRGFVSISLTSCLIYAVHREFSTEWNWKWMATLKCIANKIVRYIIQSYSHDFLYVNVLNTV